MAISLGILTQHFQTNPSINFIIPPIQPPIQPGVCCRPSTADPTSDTTGQGDPVKALQVPQVRMCPGEDGKVNPMNCMVEKNIG